MNGQNILKIRELWRSTEFSKIVRCFSTVNSETARNIDDELLMKAKPFHEMPSPPMWPIIGTGWQHLPIVGHIDPLRQHHAIRRNRQKYGDFWRETIGNLNIVISFNPEDQATVSRNEGPYPNRTEFTALKAYRESRKQWYQSTGLLVLQGKEWQDLRKKSQKHLMKPKSIEAYLGSLQQVAFDFVQRIYELKDTSGEVPNFLVELYKWALESVALVGLDTRLGCLQKDLSKDSEGLRMIRSVQIQFEMMNKLEAFLGNIPFWRLWRTPKWRKFEEASDQFSSIAFKHINRAFEELKKMDQKSDRDLTLLQALLATDGLDLGGVMVTVADMLFAGIDTTSHTAGFLLYELARNPEKQELLYQEISKNVLSSDGGKITPAILPQLRFLKSCIKETLRLHPIISANGRILDHDVVISGYRVPAKTNIVIVHQEIYLDERYFSNPTGFVPERWLNREHKSHPFAFLPFGFGPRSCIGRRLAELEIICLVTEIIQNFRVEYHYEDIDMLTKFINTPDKPLRFNFIKR